MKYEISEVDDSYIINKNGQPLKLPKTDGSYLTVKFDNKADAEGYISDVIRLSKQKRYRNYDD